MPLAGPLIMTRDEFRDMLLRRLPRYYDVRSSGMYREDTDAEHATRVERILDKYEDIMLDRLCERGLCWAIQPSGTPWIVYARDYEAATGTEIRWGDF